MSTRTIVAAVFACGVSCLLFAQAQPGAQDNPRLPPADAAGFGASGTGQVDAWPVIQKMVRDGRGTIRLPKGTYRLSRTVEVDLAKTGFTAITGDGAARVVMAGPGPAFRFIGTHYGTAAPNSVKAPVWDRERWPQVVGLEIVGEHAEACGIEAEGTMQLGVSRVLIRKVLHAVRLTKNNRNVSIADCHFYENRGIGLFLDDVNLHQINVTGCHISYNDGGGIVSRKGNVRNLQVTGCDIEANMADAGPATANVLIDTTGSNFGTGEVAITGCTIQHSNKSPDSANIRILGQTIPAKGETLARQGNVTISGNVFSDVQVNVHLKDCRGVTICSNTFWEGYTHNLFVESCSNIIVGPNNMDRNPHYDRFGPAAAARNDVQFQGCEDCTISGLHLTNVRGSSAGLSLVNCRRCNLSGITILDCGPIGLLCKNVSDSSITGALVRDDRADGRASKSLVLQGGRGNHLGNNFFGGETDVDASALAPKDAK